MTFRGALSVSASPFAHLAGMIAGKPRAQRPAPPAAPAPAAPVATLPGVQIQAQPAAAAAADDEGGDEEARRAEEEAAEKARRAKEARKARKARKAKKAKKADDPDNDDDDDDEEGDDDTDDADDEGADDDDDSEDARRARAVRAASLRATARCATIFLDAAAGQNPVMAAHLAFETRLPRSEAIALLRAAGPAVAPGASTPGAAGLDARMRNVPDTRVGAGAPSQGGDEASALVARINAAAAKARGG